VRLLVDSSSFAKRFIQEEGSEQLDEFLQQASELAVCVILVPEIISALNRRLRECALTIEDYRKAKILLLNDVSDATVLQLTPAVVSRSVYLLENSVLRAMDALHVACALEWEADLFLTSDKRQFNSAISSGLKIEYIGQP
jgi:predicted nucleic acid-binding protein